MKKPSNTIWTDQQWQCICEENKNIIVSAGAGSGKTAVLTERVIRKLKEGVHINELLILTFTKAAANSTKNRIRAKLQEIPTLESELNLLDSAYITTFDSFALSILKKYHYLININKEIGIIDKGLLDFQKEKILENIFMEHYEKKDPLFLKMINQFCVKADNNIQKYILNMDNKLNLLSNKREYLQNYLSVHFDEKSIDKDIESYFNLIREQFNKIKILLNKMDYIDSDFTHQLQDKFLPLFNSKNYEEMLENINLDIPRVPKNSDEELKIIKTAVSKLFKEIKNSSKAKDKIKHEIHMTYETVQSIINIILEFDEKIFNYKKQLNVYEYHDIAIMAINLIKEKTEVQQELTNSFNEIMIDEYQDTNDLQEEFINLIAKNNVYMVGDIKQSIYRFRNANPYIFKNKYDNYKNDNQNLKIDLSKNFRSRQEIIKYINIIFNQIMDDNIGGADYIQEHQMNYGNKKYDLIDTVSDVDIYNYEDTNDFTKEEIEAFIIAKDIQKKVHNYQIMDQTKRNIEYKDIAIIIDRSNSFDLYKKIFSYFSIPLVILKNQKMNNDDDISIIKNLINLIMLTKKNQIDQEFKHSFISIERSFLYNEKDEKIFDYFVNKNYQDSHLYKNCFQIAQKLDYLSITDLLDEILDTFNYYEKLVTLNNITEYITKIEALKTAAHNIEKLGYSIEEFQEYLNHIQNNSTDMEYFVNTNVNAVKIMTIHKSKGLEYPLCYFSGLYKSFNIKEITDKFIYNKKYGFVVPYFEEGIDETIYKTMLKNDYIKEEISEKIRLFYVALTRTKEKMILIKPINTKLFIDKLEYRSFSDMISSIEKSLASKNQIINIDKLNLTKDYNKIKLTNYQNSISKTKSTILVNEIKLENKLIDENNFSKSLSHLITVKEAETLQFGTNIHNLLELIDLKNPNYNLLSLEEQKIIKHFLNHTLFNNILLATIYKEYEFIYTNQGNKYHGIIDLMLEYDNKIDIVDYKLKNIDDDKYIKQLKGYKKYIESISPKKVNIYLYSIYNDEIKQL